MDSVSFQATKQLENKLSGIYEILYKKKSSIAARINHFTESPQSNNAHHALFLHLAVNCGAISGLYYLIF